MFYVINRSEIQRMRKKIFKIFNVKIIGSNSRLNDWDHVDPTRSIQNFHCPMITKAEKFSQKSFVDVTFNFFKLVDRVIGKCD